MFYRVTTENDSFYFTNESDMWKWIKALDYLNDPIKLKIETCVFEELQNV